MKKILIVNLLILVFLAISSGITKIILMEQDVAFFGKYGFTNPILIAYGAIQLIGGIMLIIQKTRFVGAIIVSITFLISAVVLIMDRNLSVTIFTFIAMLLLGVVMAQCLKEKNTDSTL